MRYSFHLGLLTLILVAPTAAAQDAKATRLRAALRQVVNKRTVPGARVGVVVRRLSVGREVFSLRGRELMNMASNAKLFTTAAALWHLGTDYVFRTKVIAKGKIENGVLTGDLVIVGSGDPNISDRFHNGDAMYVPRQMAAAVKRAGIARITGDLVMDDRFFDRVYHAPGWSPDDFLRWYAAPVSALSFNDNCVSVLVSGTGKVGSNAHVRVLPFPDRGIVNKCVTCGKKQRTYVTYSLSAGGAAVVGGKIRAGDDRAQFITVATPPLFLGKAIRTALNKEDVRLEGRTRLVHDSEKLTADARQVFVWKSKLTDTVSVANKRSQNLYAEMILKTIGARCSGTGTFETGTQGVAAFLKYVGFPDGTVTVADGSGLSPGNRATPQAIVGLLEVMYKSDLKEPFYDSLAVNGDGYSTLKNRLKEAAYRGRIHAKTGTITSRGISALSGYVESHDGETYAFSILINGFRSGALYRARNLENAVCRALIGAPRPKTPPKKEAAKK